MQDAPEWAKAMAQDIRELNEKVDGLVDTVSGLTDTVSGLVMQVGHLVGSDTERRAHGNIVNLASEHLSLRRVSVLQSQIIPMSEEMQGYINHAELKGSITEIQANDLRKSDIIIRAFDRANRQEVYYAFEVSNTIGNADITRAVDRAATLGAVTGAPSYPAVIGSVIDGRQAGFAADRSVKVLPIPGP